jgi:O-acetyl-ADP-ribose deacetylase (regulator of RNase III)
VLYELGIRHTARKSGTVILRQKGDPIPFNINGMRVLEYDPSTTSHAGGADAYGDVIEGAIRASLIERNVDSLVHTLMPGLNVTRRARPYPAPHTFVWYCPKAPTKKLCIMRGDIMDAYGIDVWVNPENTKMQMGRLHDDSISSNIRYYGARKDHKGIVIDDRIVRALISKMRPSPMVEAGTVLVTTPGDLWRTNAVRALCHVAAQHGEPGKGYITVRSHAACVTNVLETVDHYNNAYLCRLRMRRKLTSVIFPLFGTRGQDQDPLEVTLSIVHAAKKYFELCPWSTIERVYFLAYTDADDELLTTAFNRLKLLWEREEVAPQAATQSSGSKQAAS